MDHRDYRDYKTLFAFALSVAISRGAEDPEDMAQEAIVRLWLRGRGCKNPEAWLMVVVKGLLAKEKAAREKGSAEKARVRYRPGEESLEWVEQVSRSNCLTEDGFEQAAMDRVFLQQVIRRWGNLWRARERLGEVKAWAGVL